VYNPGGAEMNWRLIIELAPVLLFVVLVLGPKLTRSIFFESLSHPFRRSEIRVKDGHVFVVHQ
jgi:hypothetical protein